MAGITPALEPPPGVESNFENPNNTVQTWNIITQSLCIGLTTIFFVLRMYTRVLVQKTVNLEDYLCLAAWIGGIGYNVTALMMGKYGGGLHQWDVPKQNLESFSQTVYGTMVMYGPVALATKTAILLLLVRVFAPFKKLVLFTKIFLGILVAFYLPVFFVKICICTPVPHYWKKEALPGKCLNERALILADAFVSVASDVIILVLPIIASWSLHMSTQKKLRVVGLLGAGGLACGASIVRLVWIIEQGESKDATHTFMRINLWGNAEVSIGIICACLPFLASLIKKVTGEYASRHTSNMDYYQMGSTVPPRSRTRSKSQSQISLTEVASDQDILISHPHKHGKVLTDIQAQPAGDHAEQYPADFTNGGILRTVDVSHTVTSR